MKEKLIQIALGAIGSIFAVLIQYYAGGSAEVGMTVAAGSATSATLAGFVQRTLMG